VVSLEIAWKLAVAWYHDRMDLNWKRQTTEEVQAFFTKLGLTSTFWQLDPTAADHGR
jgi:hypothetical protein